MKNAAKASLLIALCFSISSLGASAQSILNQSKDDLLKDFDAGKSLTAPPINGPANTPAPTWAPSQGSSGPAAAAPSAYQFPAQQKPLLQRLFEGAMNAVNVSSNDTDGTHVKVPFVNVDVGGQTSGVRVKAPFINYNTKDGAKVKAPFVNYDSHDGARVKAPFVNVGAPSQAAPPPQVAPQSPVESPTQISPTSQISPPPAQAPQQGSSLR